MSFYHRTARASRGIPPGSAGRRNHRGSLLPFAARVSVLRKSSASREARMGQLTGRSVILTGASRGIGAAAAEALAEEGAALLLLARSAEGITQLATRLRRAGA